MICLSFPKASGGVFLAVALLAATAHGQGTATSPATENAGAEQEREARPPTHVIDQADILDERRERLLEAFLREQANSSGAAVFLLTVAQPDPLELPGELAARYRKLWFRPQDRGAVIVAVANPPRFAISVTSEAQELPGAPDFRDLMETWTHRLSTRGSPSATIRECAMDIAFSLAECVRLSAQKEQHRRPLLRGLAGLVGLAILMLLAYGVRRIHQHNLLGRQYIFPTSATPRRLDGPMSGGHSATLRYGEGAKKD